MAVFKSITTAEVLIKLKNNKKKSAAKKKPLTKAEEAAELRKKSIKKLVKGKIKS